MHEDDSEEHSFCVVSESGQSSNSRVKSSVRLYFPLPKNYPIGFLGAEQVPPIHSRFRNGMAPGPLYVSSHCHAVFTSKRVQRSRGSYRYSICRGEYLGDPCSSYPRLRFRWQSTVSEVGAYCYSGTWKTTSRGRGESLAQTLRATTGYLCWKAARMAWKTTISGSPYERVIWAFLKAASSASGWTTFFRTRPLPTWVWKEPRHCTLVSDTLGGAFNLWVICDLVLHHHCTKVSSLVDNGLYLPNIRPPYGHL